MCNIDFASFSVNDSTNLTECESNLSQRIGLDVAVYFSESEINKSYYCYVVIQYPDDTSHGFYLDPQPQYIYDIGHSEFIIRDLHLEMEGNYIIKSITILAENKVEVPCYIVGNDIQGTCVNITIKEEPSENVGSAEFHAYESDTQVELNAKLFIDDVDKGMITPTTVMQIPVGAHTYKYTLENYEDTTGNFAINAGSKTIVSDSMYPIGQKPSDSSALILVAAGIGILLYALSRNR